MSVIFGVMKQKVFGVYIMGNDRPTLYVGMTNHLGNRIYQHKIGKNKGFTKRYNLKKCLYYEYCDTAMQAIVREKQIKNMNRAEKLQMITERNPLFADLGGELLDLFGADYTDSGQARMTGR